MTDAWFASGELEAMIHSNAYPAEEIDLPDCGETTANERGTVVCTRVGGHQGRHIAAIPGSLDGHPLFAVIAAWPGTEKP